MRQHAAQRWGGTLALVVSQGGGRALMMGDVAAAARRSVCATGGAVTPPASHSSAHTAAPRAISKNRHFLLSPFLRRTSAHTDVTPGAWYTSPVGVCRQLGPALRRHLSSETTRGARQVRLPSTTQDGQGHESPKGSESKDTVRALTGDHAQDYDRFFDILTLPIQSPMVAKREELKLVDVDEARFFRNRVRTVKHYNILIRAQAEAKIPLESIQRTFENMLRYHMVPNVEVYTSLIVACAKAGNPRAAEQYLQKMTEEGLVPNIWTYTALTQAYTRSGQLEEAFKVLEKVKAAGIRPNVVLYTSLVHGCLQSNDVDRAWDTFDFMRQREAIEPDEVAFTLMINACAKKAEVERAENLMEEMRLLQLQPTEVTYNSQINACARRRDYYKEAFVNLERMKAAGFRPDSITYSTLLHASAKNGDTKMAETLFKTMNDSGMLTAKPETTHAWNSLLLAYATAQPRADSVTRGRAIATSTRILDAMEKAGQQPDLYTANTVLSLYAHAHRIRQAEAFFEAAFLTPRTLSSHASHKSVELASGQLARDNNSFDNESRPGWSFSIRFQPDVVSYTCLIQLYADTRRPEKALQVWHMMKDSGVEPNMRTYEYMVRALARAAYLNTAMKILREMREHGFVPHDHVINLLMLRTKAYPELREEVRRLTDLPLPKQMDPKSLLAIRMRRNQRADRDLFPPTPSARRRRAPLHRPV